jgi:hypothetical protein
MPEMWKHAVALPGKTRHKVQRRVQSIRGAERSGMAAQTGCCVKSDDRTEFREVLHQGRLPSAGTPIKVSML